MAEQDANSVAITGGSVNGTTIGAITASTGRFTSVTTPSVTATVDNLAINSVGTGTITLSSGNGIAFRALDNGTTGNSWAAYGSTVSPVLEASGSATNVNGIVRTKGTGIIAFRTNTVDEQLRVSHTASAVNYVQVTGAATGGNPTLSAQGSDADVGVTLNTKGSGLIRLQTAGNTRLSIDNTGSTTKLGLSASGGTGFQVTATGSQVNSLATTGTVSGSNNVVLSTQGTDTNIDLSLTPKGTGLVRFGTYVAGALTATGYINIKAANGTTYKVLVST
jgi:hypothetical protein